ncbi:hypothetical protein AVT69_gp360 [Pseudomonas phage PhiPA3]|uniref:Uncharacterized protein 376 n=1 Tax=Pseudomonas phage PhiPA3 TaxID=998086 RepID=F8SJK8_BPPA3|nr:hypothetical protein AVT69_gp360 [Pseudomonas phage PhiPA3]AEH03799.1 hypothetical protein [Pseudomonas phage PhiPA3]
MIRANWMNSNFKAIALILMLGSTTVHADEIVSESTGVVRRSDCTLVAKDTSVVGTAVGGTAGGVGGAVVEKALFGKSGGWIGGLAGAAIGSAIGNDVSSVKTYTCNMVVDVDGSKQLVEAISNSEPRVGAEVTILKMSSGQTKILK